MEYKITLTEEQEKCLLTEMKNIQDWINNAIQNKARQTTDRIIRMSGQGSEYSAPEQKSNIIKKLISDKSTLLKTAEEKQMTMPV